MNNESVSPAVIINQSDFVEKLEQYYLEKSKKKPYTRVEITKMISEIVTAKNKTQTEHRREYHLLNKYDILTIGSKSHLIRKSDDIQNVEYIVPYEDLFETIYDYHVNKTGHGGRTKMEKAFLDKLNVPRSAIEIFLTCCKTCNEIKSSSKKIVVKPILSSDFAEGGQIDLIDLQSLPCGEFYIVTQSA
ncbi:SCAN domain-containing protein 3-like [Leptopilina boulardi]|uniref:SCAN domain-containing protein 3-like n=1 Tax=Leptopilina boulardi TaxID=63433 RepID=UPI0021F52E9E|nr:SCAN domain-containing protein 3-like [Leptopilina boulardi]